MSTVCKKYLIHFFTTKLGQRGSGLGLSIAYNIVTAMLGGRVEVTSEVGIGTQFMIEIPLTASTELAEPTFA